MSFGSEPLLEELLDDFLLLGESMEGLGTSECFGDSGLMSSLLSELESEDFFDLGDSPFFFDDELDLDFGLIGTSGVFSFDELEEDELLDFFLSTGGSFSSAGTSGFDGMIGSAGLGFSGSNIFSFGPDLLLEELEEDFLGDLGFGSTTLGDSGFLISSLFELDSESFSIAGSAGSTGSECFSGIFSLCELELEDEDFGDFGLSAGRSFSDSLELSEDFGFEG